MDRKIKWGVIGAGGIADRRTMPGMMLAKNAELIAVMDVNENIIEGLKEKYHAKYAYTNADDLIANPEVEAVYIATPVVFHAEQAVKAARAGKHVLMEKPIAMTVAQGRQVIADVDACGVKSACGFMMRFGALNQQIKKFIADGNRVKVSVRFRGREMAHTDIGRDLLDRFAAQCAETANLDKPAKLEGRMMSIFLSPKSGK